MSTPTIRSRNSPWTSSSGSSPARSRTGRKSAAPDAPITVYSRENSSGTYEFFKEHVLKGKDFAASAQTMPGTAAVLQAVAKDKNGIGYGGAAYGAGAKHLPIKTDDASPAIEPTEENVVRADISHLALPLRLRESRRWTRARSAPT